MRLACLRHGRVFGLLAGSRNLDHTKCLSGEDMWAKVDGIL